MRDYYLRYPEILTNTLVPPPGLSSILQNQLGVALDALITPGKVFMTRGWGEIARVCRTVGALVIHLEYDGASLMFFKVFDAEGCRLECCPRESGRGDEPARTWPAHRPSSSSSGGSGGAGESSGSPELLATPEMSDESYEPSSSRGARSGVAASSRRRH